MIRFLIVFFLMLLIAVKSVVAQDGASTASAVDELNVYVEHWLSVEEEIANEEREWKEKKAQLRHELELLNRRDQQLDAEWETLQARVSSRSEEAEQLIKTVRDGEKLLHSFEPFVSRAVILFETALDAVPLPLRDQVRYDGGTETMAEQIQQVLFGYASLGTLADDLHVVSELLMVGEQNREMDVMYLGIGRAYAVSKDNQMALLGSVRKDGSWSWNSAGEYAKAIRLAIDVYRQAADIQLVELPMSAGVVQ